MQRSFNAYWSNTGQACSAPITRHHRPRPASPLGDKIKACVDAFPYLQLDASLQPITRSVLRIQLSLTPAFEWRVGGAPARRAGRSGAPHPGSVPPQRPASGCPTDLGTGAAAWPLDTFHLWAPLPPPGPRPALPAPPSRPPLALPPRRAPPFLALGPQEKAHGQALRWWVWVEDTETEYLYHSESWVLTKKMAR
jgi:hypothetical protein